MGTTSLLSYLLLSLFAYQALCQGTTTAPCCNTKTVKDAPSGQEDLNGEYVLNPSSSNSHANCADGCIYTRNDEEYCFMNVAVDKAAGSITCDATTGGPAAGASTPGAGAGGSTPGAGAGESTPQGGAGATTPSAGGAGATTASAGGTTASVAERGQAAQESKTAATTEKAAAETTKAAADESTTQAALVASKIDEVVASASGRRMKRQETPTTCATFQTMVTNMNDAINLGTDAGYATATSLGKLLAVVVAANVGCTSDDVAALNTAKSKVEAAQAVLVSVSAVLQNAIKEAIDAINAAIAEITAVNIIFAASGKSTLADPGTTLATVTAPSLATEAAAEATTPAAVAGATTPAAVAGATTPAAVAGATTPAAGATTPAAGATTPAAEATTAQAESTPPSTMISTVAPGSRKFFGKRSRGSIL